jgi:hypothetical protein
MPRPGSASTEGPPHSTYDVLTRQVPMRDAIQETAVPRLHIVPSTMDLSGFELEIANERDRAYRLRDTLARSTRRRGRGPVQLRADRLPALAQPRDRQRDGGVALDPGAAAMRVLRARRTCRSC